MKVSDLIKTLQASQVSYGDIEVTMTIAANVDNPPVERNGNGEVVMSADITFIGYDQFEDHDEINLRTFPY